MGISGVREEGVSRGDGGWNGPREGIEKEARNGENGSIDEEMEA